MTSYWPVADLRLTDGRLQLRPMVEADLEPLAALLPSDVEQNPALPDLGSRATRLAQEYWQSLGGWRTDSWNLGLVVSYDGAMVGVQRLEGDDFAERRTVDSSSWLATGARGRGIGKAMRRTVLALAFDGLGAEVAETSAWADNYASIGVSRAVGYEPNGLTRHADRGRVGDLVKFRLTRSRWAGADVTIANLEPCLPFFGLAARSGVPGG
jgi:RimJ/RimL family protein N-acetyltransferase